ncbi:MAG TPA: GNAT family N-acetyltransferase [Polyangiaceae bacterium]
MLQTHNVLIRDAAEPDSEAIREMTLAAYAQYEKAMPEAVWAGFSKQLLTTLTTDTPAQRIVAEQEGALVGSVYLFPADTNAHARAALSMGCPEVRLLAVPPEMRGRGIARALMEECAVRARRAGANALGLHTTAVMRDAIRLYERMQYARAPEFDFTPPVKGVVVTAYRLDLR